jgi:hypothetical protein
MRGDQLLTVAGRLTRIVDRCLEKTRRRDFSRPATWRLLSMGCRDRPPMRKAQPAALPVMVIDWPAMRR